MFYDSWAELVNFPFCQALFGENLHQNALSMATFGGDMVEIEEQSVSLAFQMSRRMKCNVYAKNVLVEDALT